MQLSKRPPVYELPSYSLTGDLVGFLRCGLQYRFNTVGHLPSARPVQAWFGQYIHGVLEEAYRRFDLGKSSATPTTLPWPASTLDEIRELIKRRLSAQQLFPGDEELEELGDRRADVAVNELGPLIFPLISRAEVKLNGARMIRKDLIPPAYQFRAAERYEMVGVVDVITHVELQKPEFQRNPLVQAIITQLPQQPPSDFEVIIDYKGMRRPPLKPAPGSGLSFWEIYAWQTQTYAHLRSLQEGSAPVVAGVIIYLNELLPSKEDMKNLQKDLARKETDVVPTPGSADERLILAWTDNDDPPTLSFDFRLRRALRVMPVTPASIDESLKRFDEVVAKIEESVGRELVGGVLFTSWRQDASDEGTCAACDARTFCPTYKKETAPRLPGIRPKKR